MDRHIILSGIVEPRKMLGRKSFKLKGAVRLGCCQAGGGQDSFPSLRVLEYGSHVGEASIFNGMKEIRIWAPNAS